MIPELRRRFNESFTAAKYADFLKWLDEGSGTPVLFRNSETPVFLPRGLAARMAQEGEELIRQLIDSAEYRIASDQTIPEQYRVPGEDSHPLFIQVDFGLTADLEPKLVEIQGFPSLYAYQPFLAELYKEAYGLPAEYTAFLPGTGSASYNGLLRRAICGDHDPENVVLLEIDPYHQKTLADFLLTQKLLGIRIAPVTEVERRGRRLYYQGVPIERIYNRVIVDELVRKGVQPGFDFRDELDVEWAGHPNWYFRISKFSLPFLNHPSVPKTWFLDRLEGWPDDLENWVLKPLYSFAGLGVRVGPSRKDLDEITKRSQFILQQRVDFAPLIETPHGPTKAEFRIMYIWLDELRPVTTIVRMGRGKMMGVDHNRDLEWVGGSVAFVTEP
jgi:hypothetical protein